MSELDALYQEVILDHNRRPRHYGELPDADRRVVERNPLCGDTIALSLKLGAGRIDTIRFTAAGCAISRASASLMSEAVAGRSVDEADALFGRVHAMLLGKEGGDDLGALKALAGVSRFPVRVKCASMAWHALRSALHAEGAAAAPPGATTE